MKKIIGFTLGILFSVFLTAQEEVKKVETITFTTSAECGMCKKKIEGELNYAKGIVFCEVDYKEKTITVKYKTKQTTEQTIKKSIALLGYDAGDVKANEKAYKELPECCKVGAHGN